MPQVTPGEARAELRRRAAAELERRGVPISPVSSALTIETEPSLLTRSRFDVPAMPAATTDIPIQPAERAAEIGAAPDWRLPQREIGAAPETLSGPLIGRYAVKQPSTFWDMTPEQRREYHSLPSWEKEKRFPGVEPPIAPFGKAGSFMAGAARGLGATEKQVGPVVEPHPGYELAGGLAGEGAKIAGMYATAGGLGVPAGLARNLAVGLTSAGIRQAGAEEPSLEEAGLEVLAYAALPELFGAVGSAIKKPKIAKPPIVKLANKYVKVSSVKRGEPAERHAGLHPAALTKKKSPLRLTAEDEFLGITREKKAKIHAAHERARKWEKSFTETEREQVGALVEGVEHLRTGKGVVLTKKLEPLFRQYKTFQETSRREINEFLEGVGKSEYISFLKDYLPHFYVGKLDKAKMNRWLTNSPNARQRKIPTLRDAQNLGLTPLTQDVAQLHKMWNELNWKVAANKKIVHSFKHLKDETGKLAVRTGDRPGPEWKIFDHPAISKVFARRGKDGTLHLWRGGVWVHPDVVPVARMAFENPWTDRGKIGRTIDVINAFAKTSELALSGFHAIALTESGQAMLASGKNPLRGVFLFGKEAKSVTGKPFALTFRAGKKIQQIKPGIVEDAIRHGLNLGSARADMGYNIVSKALRTAEVKTAKIPVANWSTRKLRQGYELMNKALWEQIHEGYKTYSYYSIVKDELARLPAGVTKAQTKTVKQDIARVLNDAFGGQEWESKFWLSPKELMYARRFLLAPDWTLSNISIAGRATMEHKNPLVRRLAMRYWRNMAMSVFGTTQALNMALTGHPTWENEIGHKIDIDVTSLKHQIQKTIGTYDPKNKQRYYVRLAKQAREVLSYAQDPLKITGNKLSPVVREIWKQGAGAQPGSGFPADWTRERKEFWDSIPSRIKSAVLIFRPFSLSGNNFAFSLPMSKGMTNYKAIRMYQKALDARSWWVFGKRSTQVNTVKEINEATIANGLNTKQLYAVAMAGVRSKYYDEFHKALEDKNWKKTNEVAERLRSLGATDKQIIQSIERRSGK